MRYSKKKEEQISIKFQVCTLNYGTHASNSLDNRDRILWLACGVTLADGYIIIENFLTKCPKARFISPISYFRLDRKAILENFHFVYYSTARLTHPPTRFQKNTDNTQKNLSETCYNFIIIIIIKSRHGKFVDAYAEF